MSIDKKLLDQLMEGRSSGDLFGKEGILAELTKALAERALTAEMEEHLGQSAKKVSRRARTIRPIVVMAAARRL